VKAGPELRQLVAILEKMCRDMSNGPLHLDLIGIIVHCFLACLCISEILELIFIFTVRAERLQFGVCKLRISRTPSPLNFQDTLRDRV